MAMPLKSVHLPPTRRIDKAQTRSRHTASNGSGGTMSGRCIVQACTPPPSRRAVNIALRAKKWMHIRTQNTSPDSLYRSASTFQEGAVLLPREIASLPNPDEGAIALLRDTAMLSDNGIPCQIIHFPDCVASGLPNLVASYVVSDKFRALMK